MQLLVSRFPFLCLRSIEELLLNTNFPPKFHYSLLTPPKSLCYPPVFHRPANSYGDHSFFFFLSVNSWCYLWSYIFRYFQFLWKLFHLFFELVSVELLLIFSSNTSFFNRMFSSVKVLVFFSNLCNSWKFFILFHGFLFSWYFD